MYKIAVGSIIPYNGDFYKITAINGYDVTLINNPTREEKSKQINVSYKDLKKTIISHNSLLGKRKSRSQSPKSSSKRSKRIEGGKKSRKKSTLKRGK